MRFLLLTILLLTFSFTFFGQNKTPANAQNCPVIVIEGVQLGMTIAETKAIHKLVIKDDADLPAPDNKFADIKSAGGNNIRLKFYQGILSNITIVYVDRKRQWSTLHDFSAFLSTAYDLPIWEPFSNPRDRIATIDCPKYKLLALGFDVSPEWNFYTFDIETRNPL